MVRSLLIRLLALIAQVVLFALAVRVAEELIALLLSGWLHGRQRPVMVSLSSVPALPSRASTDV